MALSPVAILSLAALGLAVVVIAAQKDAPAVEDGQVIVPDHPVGPVPANASVLLLGDSIAVGIDKHLQKLVSGPYEARVKVGRTVAGVIGALHGDEPTWDVILLSAGSNDALTNPAAFAQTIDTLIEKTGGDASRIFWIVPPGFTYSTSKNLDGAAAFTDAMNQAGIRVVSTSPVPPAPDDPMRLHLAPSGYHAFAQAIADGLYL